MSEQTRAKCADLIDKELKGRLKDIEKGLESEDPVEWINGFSLAFSKLEVYRLELSYGGPQDYIEFHYDKESKELVKITYHYLDWFDGAELSISPDCKEWETLSALFELVHVE